MVRAKVIQPNMRRLMHVNEEQEVKSLKRRSWALSLTIIHLSYTPVSLKIFQTFVCEVNMNILYHRHFLSCAHQSSPSFR